MQGITPPLHLQLNDIFMNAQRQSQELSVHLESYVSFMQDYG